MMPLFADSVLWNSAVPAPFSNSATPPSPVPRLLTAPVKLRSPDPAVIVRVCSSPSRLPLKLTAELTVLMEMLFDSVTGPLKSTAPAALLTILLVNVMPSAAV